MGRDDSHSPVRPSLLPYGRQSIDEEDIQAVVDVLRSDWLTTGPAVDAFEQAFCEKLGCKFAVAVGNGTQALHLVTSLLELKPEDEVIVPAMTFAASANCVAYVGAQPVFADVHPESLLIDAASVEQKITKNTKAIIAVDFAGQPCDYDALRELAGQHSLALVDDAAHSVGGEFKGRVVGTLADLNTFSFHPVKHVATGEGGMITTDNPDFAKRLRVLRNHGITTDFKEREDKGSFFYDMAHLGFNYRLSDLQCALGISQLKKLEASVARRNEIASQYDNAFSKFDFISPLQTNSDLKHAHHLYVVRLDGQSLSLTREEAFSRLRADNIGVNVHYRPVYLHSYYRKRYGTQEGLCPIAEAAYEQIISLPMFPAMSDQDVSDVVEAVSRLAN